MLSMTCKTGETIFIGPRFEVEVVETLTASVLFKLTIHAAKPLCAMYRRKRDEWFTIANGVRMLVQDTRLSRVQIGIEAPRELSIHASEREFRRLAKEREK